MRKLNFTWELQGGVHVYVCKVKQTFLDSWFQGFPYTCIKWLPFPSPRYYEWQTKDGEKQPYYIYKTPMVKGEVKEEVKDEKQDVKVKAEVKPEGEHRTFE